MSCIKNSRNRNYLSIRWDNLVCVVLILGLVEWSPKEWDWSMASIEAASTAGVHLARPL